MRRAGASTFVGRIAELEKIERLLGASPVRLVTIWGMGGMGKTRLALEVCKRADKRRAATLFVDLSETQSAEGLCAALASALDAPIGPAASASQLRAQVGRALAARGEILVLFDNVEQLIDDAAQEIGSLLEAAPKAKLLVTSRQRLRVPGETAFELPPLSITQGETSPSDAERLFIVRAEEMGISITNASATTVASLIRKLEGIPLAIELAAARLDVLGLTGLMQRLAAPLDLLTEGPRGAPARHKTMRAAVTWSWELMTRDERDALAALSVFRGGFTLEAAEAVLDRGDVLGIVGALRAKSLLLASSSGDQAPRFVLYDVVRAYGLDVLKETGRLDEATKRHDAYFVTSARAWSERVRRTGDLEARALLARELDNLMDVHARAVARVPTTRASAERACIALLAADVVLTTRAGSDTVLKAWRTTFELGRGAGLDADLRSELEAAYGRALFAAGELDAAQRLLEGALEGALALERPDLEASHALDLGLVFHRRGDLKRARKAYERALAAGRTEEARRSEARALGNLAALDHDERAFEKARARYKKSIAVAATIRDAQVEGIMTTNLAVLEQEEEKLDRALALYRRAVELLDQCGDRRLLAIARANLGMAYAEQGSLVDARRGLEGARDALRTMGDAHSLALTLARLGAALALAGDRNGAADALTEADALFTEMGNETGAKIVSVVEQAIDLPTLRASGIARVRKAVAAAAPLAKLSGATRNDARTIFRLIERALDRLDRGGPAETDDRTDALLMGPRGESFKPPNGEWQWIGDHRAACAIAARLVERAVAREKEGLSIEQMAAIGWPGQKILASAAANRIYVLVAWLKKKGFPVVRRDGYVVDPEVPVQTVTRTPAAAAKSPAKRPRKE